MEWEDGRISHVLRRAEFVCVSALIVAIGVVEVMGGGVVEEGAGVMMFRFIVGSW